VITRTGVHAIRAMAALGGVPPGGYAGAAEISFKIKAPPNYLAKLLGKLSRAGLVSGQRGAHGGFRLARSAEDITLFEILEPIEDLGRLRKCFLGKARCSDRGACVLHPEWSKIRDRYVGFLKRTRLRSVMEDDEAKGG
jgi:Rrf2 family iron-sulfur cluster assembly transcriptional regulator